MTQPSKMSAADVRRAFLDYFTRAGHTVVTSSSLVPGNDPTLLFTNAGMVQFKDLFLGKEQRHYVRAATSQPRIGRRSLPVVLARTRAPNAMPTAT